LRHKPIYTRPGSPPGLAFTPDGSVLLTSSGSGLQAWGVATGTGLGELAAVGTEAADLSLSADGRLAAFGLGFRRGAEVWDVAGRSPVAHVPVDRAGGPVAVALSPDGRALAVSNGLTVQLWDVGTRELLHELDQGGAMTLSLEFSPDGRLLATGATLWEVATGARVSPNLAPGTLPMVDLSPDGRQLLVTTEDRVVVWDVDPASWAERACAIANRTLTTDEWDRFLPGRPYEPACAR
jgi:WD40 repeat protein